MRANWLGHHDYKNKVKQMEFISDFDNVKVKQTVVSQMELLKSLVDKQSKARTRSLYMPSIIKHDIFI